MPNTNRPLPISCPKCRYEGSTLVVKSISVMTLTCVSCFHTWAAELAALPGDIQIRVERILRDT